MEKIAVIGLNYYPEDSSTGLYTTEMVEHLSKEFDVEVVTGYPYYPEWEIWKQYRDKRGELIEEANGVKVCRVRQYVPKKVNFINRVVHYWDFYRKTLKVLNRKDLRLVMVILPNIFLLKLGIKYRKKNSGCKIWAHVQDFEIDAGLETLKKIAKIPLLAKVLHSIEKSMFSKFDVVSTISDGMMAKLDKKGVAGDKQYFLPNWADISFIFPKESSVYREKLGIEEDEFVVMYSGNIGKKEDWDTVINCVKKLKDNSNVKFVIAGDGNKREYVFDKLKALSNVILLPPQPKDMLNEFLNLADLHVIPQKREEKDSFMPSKLLGITAVGKPPLCLANRESSVYRVVVENDIGYVLNEDEYDKFSEKILEISSDRKHMEEKGRRARDYVVENYEYKNIMGKLSRKIKTTFL